MRYFGSKASAVHFVADRIQNAVPKGTLCDPFGGIGVVGACMKARGYEVHTGDIMRFAHYFQVARIVRSRRPSFSRVLESLGAEDAAGVVAFLNQAHPLRGWLTRQFSESRSFLTDANARRADACRLWVREWWENGLLTLGERAVLLASLIESVDAVANTAGTYYAHLKHWHRKALRPFRFRLLAPTPGPAGCTSTESDAADLVRGQTFDVLYLDPPYNQRSYAHYYHLPESLALGQTPRATGKSGISNASKPGSDFYSHTRALTALDDILGSSRFRLAVFHYADDGLMPPAKLRSLLREHGKLTEETVMSRGYTSRPKVRRIRHRLYLVSNA